MKTPLTLFFILFIGLSFGQSELVWHDNLEEAVKISKKEKKPIMMFFTGSDWCGWCIRLQKEVFFKDEFTKWAEENVVLLELDFPRRKALAPDIKAQNMKLQSQFAIRGYPTIWFVTPDKDTQGNLQWVKRGRTGYVAGGPGPWISNANNLLGTSNKDETKKKAVPPPPPVKAKENKKDVPAPTPVKGKG